MVVFFNSCAAPAPHPINIDQQRIEGRVWCRERMLPPPNAELVNTYWKLTELDGKPAALGAAQKELHMVLEPGKNRVRGFSGCNQFSGSYRKNANQLKFGPMAATMMACGEGMEQEQIFLKTLGQTERYTIKGDHLALYGANTKMPLRFRAFYQK